MIVCEEQKGEAAGRFCCGQRQASARTPSRVHLVRIFRHFPTMPPTPPQENILMYGWFGRDIFDTNAIPHVCLLPDQLSMVSEQHSFSGRLNQVFSRTESSPPYSLPSF
jgi:hypothetical protein